VTRKQMGVATRAQLAAWHGHLTRSREAAALRVRRNFSALLIVGGALGMIGGGFLIARWAAGLVIVAESLFACYVGLNRDDGAALPAQGARSAAEVLADERRYP